MGITSMYSVRQMKALKQQQYRELLVNQYKLGNEYFIAVQKVCFTEIEIMTVSVSMNV